MKEIQDIVKAYNRAQKQGKQTALATVVLVEGSAYRRAGARMLITQDGELTGAISGGCLEGDALRKARLVMAQQQPMLVTYDTMDDDDAKLGVGLGCNGIIHILIEPINSKVAQNPISLLNAIINNRQNYVVVTLFSLQNRKAAQPGTCLLVTGYDEPQYILTDTTLKNILISDALKTLQSEKSTTKTYFEDSEYIAFFEYVEPVISLIVIGAGNDVIPLTKIAAVLGWDITVIDGRANYALPARFTDAKKVITSKPEQVLQHFKIDSRTAIVLMTHNYNYELAMLKQLLSIKVKYIGVLGPKKKLERLLTELADNGLQITDEQTRAIYGPVGLDIGAEGAEEIALSIASEIKAVLSNRKGYPLRDKTISIHASEHNTSYID